VTQSVDSDDEVDDAGDVRRDVTQVTFARTLTSLAAALVHRRRVRRAVVAEPAAQRCALGTVNATFTCCMSYI